MRFALFFVAYALWGQTTTSLQSRGCRGNTVQVTLSVPMSAGAVSIPVPVCAELGTGLSLNTSVNPPRLEASVPAPVLPRAVVEKIPVPPATPAGPNMVLGFALKYTPHPSAAVLVAFRSSRLGGDAIDMAIPGGGASPKSLQVTLPDYRPFTADDTLLIMYWTTDAP